MACAKITTSKMFCHDHTFTFQPRQKESHFFLVVVAFNTVNHAKWHATWDHVPSRNDSRIWHSIRMCSGFSWHLSLHNPHMRPPRLHWMLSAVEVRAGPGNLSLYTHGNIFSHSQYTNEVMGTKYTCPSTWQSVFLKQLFSLQFSTFPHPRNYHMRYICQLYNQYCTVLPNSTCVLLD